MEYTVKLTKFEYKCYNDYVVPKKLSVTNLIFLVVLLRERMKGFIRNGLSAADKLTLECGMIVQTMMLKDGPAEDYGVDIAFMFEDDDYAYCEKQAASFGITVPELIRHAILVFTQLELESKR